jgi:hypothetical protein
LIGLGTKARTHPSYKTASNLLNEKFQKSSAAQRRAVLDAADWLIGLLDQLNAPGEPTLDRARPKIRRMLLTDTEAIVESPPPISHARGRQIGRRAFPPRIESP